MTKTVSIKITDVKKFESTFDGCIITAVAFFDGKTIRTKEFRSERNLKIGESIKAEKIGSGKYAGYTF